MLSCASTGRLSGGDKDVDPPVLDEQKSTPNKQLNFHPDVLTFYFDEFVEVKDPLKQILVSPPLTYLPKAQARGKKITFTFDDKEVLRENATYTINFGDAVVDFREGNILKNFTYVFSTGDYLDSLNITGKIINSQTRKGEPEMIVLLYDSYEDSIVNKEKPFYFAKPDEDGNFHFANIKSDTFKIFGLKDENLNYKYDLESELIAFSDSLIHLDGHSVDSIILRSFLPIPELKLNTRDIRNYGKAAFQYNTKVPEDYSKISIVPDNFPYTLEIKGDSVNVYYDTVLDSFNIYLFTDTIKVMPKGRETWVKKGMLSNPKLTPVGKILKSDSIVLEFNHPLSLSDYSAFVVSDTLGPIDDVVFGYAPSGKRISLKHHWTFGQNYKITIDSAKIKSIYGHTNDRIELDFSVLSQVRTTSLAISVTDLDSSQVYILNVLRGNDVIYTERLSDVTFRDFFLQDLRPEAYDLELFMDENDNGIWDTGDYHRHIQPEYYLTEKTNRLQENRDNEVNISWKDAFIPVEKPKQTMQADDYFNTLKR